jgi:ATP-dependent DNA helicase RecG
VGGEITGFKRADLPEYPLEALREAVVNAIVHRDYGRIGEAIRVFIYPDRVEVHSPGLLLPGIAVEDLVQMRVASRPRNLLLAQFMRDIPGYMERVGSGIRLMINEMRRLGLPDPEFTELHEFVVTFRNGLGVGENEAKPETRLNSRQMVALQLVREKGSLSSGEYRAATGASESTALRDLNELVERGILTTKGKKRGLRYFLVQ